MSTAYLTDLFKETYHLAPEAIFFAPGRVNLIGEHIDYNGGLVFPCAITKGTYVAARKRTDRNFNLYSGNFKEIGLITTSLDKLTFSKEDAWANYVKGVLSTLIEKGHAIPFGLDLAVWGDLPNSAGLSSSASLELVMCKTFDAFYDLKLSPTEMALIGKQVENNYIGVNSGIMDQFAVALGKPDTALLLDCATQKYEFIPFEMNDHTLVIMNTNKKRALADSKYNERFSECTTVLNLLKSHYEIANLCDLKSAELPKLKNLVSDDTLFRRLRHVITENERVISATQALKTNDLVTFGKLLCASHESLKNDYEVTGKELDTLASAAMKEGALGARMTGAGFGGCAIALVQNDLADSLIEKVAATYQKEIGYEASFYKATVGGGPIRLI